jgi:hypothetical protein
MSVPVPSSTDLFRTWHLSNWRSLSPSCLYSYSWAWAGNPYWRGKFSTVDLLELSSLYQLILNFKFNLPLLQNELPKFGGHLYWAYPSVRVPWLGQDLRLCLGHPSGHQVHRYLLEKAGRTLRGLPQQAPTRTSKRHAGPPSTRTTKIQ